MTYMVQWAGVTVADDLRTLSILGKMRPGSVELTGCGTCASCTGVRDVLALESVEPVYTQQTVAVDGSYGVTREGEDYVVPVSPGVGMMLQRAGTGWTVVPLEMAEVAQVAEIEMAPWFHASNPATGDFYGAIVTDLQGALDRPTSAKVSEGLSDGGWVTGLREGPRDVRMKMVLLAGSEMGLNAGLAWLAGVMESHESNTCGSGVTMQFGVACPGETTRISYPDGQNLALTDRQLVGCFVIDGPDVNKTVESCGLWAREIEVAVLSTRGKLMRPTMDHLDFAAGTSGAGVVVQTITSPPALCPPNNSINVMRDPSSTIPPSPVPPAGSGASGNRTTFSHKKRVTVPVPDEPWVSRALRITLHAPAGTDIPGARVRVFPTSNYTSCGEVAEFYVQYIRRGYALVVDAIEGEMFAWTGSEGNWAQASHLVRSIYSDGYFEYPVIGGDDGFYVVVESEGDAGISVESAVIE